jgi:tetratricopeptide (TPR) repeat protein
VRAETALYDMTALALKRIGKNAPPRKVLKQIQALQMRGMFAESLPLCERLASAGFSTAHVLHFHGLALRAVGNLDGALQKIHAAHEENPNDAVILNSLGVVFLQMKENELAIDIFKQATKIDDQFYDAWKNLGIALRAEARYQSAEIAFTCAHHLDRQQLEPLLNLIYMLIDIRSYKRAEEVMDNLLSNVPEVTAELMLKRLNIATRLQDTKFIEEHYHSVDTNQLTHDQCAELANIWAYNLTLTGRHDEANEVYRKWFAIESSHKAQFGTSLGLGLAEDGHLEEAISVQKEVLKEHPDHIASRYNLSLLQYRIGDIAAANRNYETRWRWREFPSKNRNFNVQSWAGQDLKNKKILVWREQGIGDEIRYTSLLNELADLECEVTFECSPKLTPLFTDSFPSIQVREEGPIECRGDPAYKKFDYQIPLGSLGQFFRNSLEEFEAKQVPWISRYPKNEALVRDALQVDEKELLVGICWRSSNQLITRNQYFFDTHQLLPLTNLPNVNWLNVQYDAKAEELAELRANGLPIHDFPDVNQKDDLVSASSLIGACDIIISVGGAVGDLSGGLGVPMIYVTRKNSEVFLGTGQSPWFPNSQSFPMKPNTGDAIIEQIISRWPDLTVWARETSPSASSSHSEKGPSRTITHPPSDGLDHKFPAVLQLATSIG